MTAYELVKKYGWRQGSFGGKDAGFCVVGAINLAYHGFDKKWCKAIGKVQKLIGGIAIPLWNDEPGRTRRQVLTLLRKAGV
jgi:hypothetical protein